MSEKQRSSRLGPVAGVGRRVQVAGIVIGALVVGVGYGYAKPAATPAASAGQSASHATTTPVSSATVVCPVVKDNNSTNITTFTPDLSGVGTSGTATENVVQQGGGPNVLTAGKPGTLAVAPGLSGGSAAGNDISNPVVAHAAGPDAPGFTMTETLPSQGSGSDAGFASQNCASPDSDFWFVGFGQDSNPYPLLNMVNADNVAASVTITMYTATGQLAASESTALQGLTLLPNTQTQELLSPTTFDQQKQGGPYAIHVVATAGRIAASMLDYDDNGAGRDFIGGQKSSSRLVIPGIPAAQHNEKVRLSLLSPVSSAAVSLRWVGHSTLSPALPTSFSGNLVPGRVTTVDLSSIPAAGEYAALEVCSADSAANQCQPVTGDGGPASIVGEVSVVQSDGNGQDTAYSNPVQPLTGDAIIADNQGGSVLTLTNTDPSNPAQVKVTQTGNGNTPTVVTNTVTVQPGQTVDQTLAMPKNSNDFALTVTPLGGASSVYAARIDGSGSAISIQPMTTAAETVTIPAVGQDASGLVPQN